MDTDDLKTLRLVAQRGSFAGAARVLNVDPSSVSRSVASVEAELGVRIFQRSTRRLSVTEAGRIYLDRLDGLLEALNEAQDAAAGASRGPEGRVRIAASVAFGHEILVPLLPSLRARLPNIEPELVLSDEAMDLVGAEIDLAVRLAPAPSGDLISARLMHTRYKVVASPDYERPSSPADLSDRDCLRLTLPDFRTQWRFRGPNGAEEVVPVSGSVTISNPLALREAARLGQGPALIADWIVARDLDAGRLIDLFPNHRVTATTFDTGAWLLYPSRRHLPLKIRAVIDFLRLELGKTA